MSQEENGAVAGIVGQIKAIDGVTPPEKWALCDGRLLLIDEHPALFAVIAARFGGDGSRTFALPELNDEHRFAICTDGYFPRRGVPPAEWKLAAEEGEYIERQVHVYRQGYRQGIPPVGQHTHGDDVDPNWLEWQVRLLQEGYAQGRDPLHRHTPGRELDPAWLERQTQVLIDAYTQGEDQSQRHTPHSHLDPEWLEWQAQVLVDAYGRRSHPLETHTHVDDVDPEWLEWQAQVLIDAYSQEQDAHWRHPHVSHLDPVWLAAQVDAVSKESEDEPVEDLGSIEGIGPKVAALLRDAGIPTFAELAATDPERLRDLLRGAGLHMVQPDTWPEQAALAVDGKWDELAALQDQLKGGRRARAPERR